MGSGGADSPVDAAPFRRCRLVRGSSASSPSAPFAAALAASSCCRLLYSAPALSTARQSRCCEQQGGDLRAGPPLSRRATTRGAGGSSSRAFRACSLTCSPLPAANSLSPRSPLSVTVTVVCSLVGWFAKVSRLGVGRGPSRIRAAFCLRHSVSALQGPRADPKVCAFRWFACRACSRNATRRAGSGTFSAQNSSNARRTFSFASASAVAKKST